MKATCFLFFIFLISCEKEQKDAKAHLNEFELIKNLERFDLKLAKAESGDWLYEHKETGQTLEQYKLISPVTPNDIQKNIYLQPIGEFSPEQDSIVYYTSEYLKLFFNLNTVILNRISDSLITTNNRRQFDDGHEQFLTSFILDSLLLNKIPKDAIVFMAITSKDLYPKPSWNYVFGQAYTKKRTGVSSIYRYFENGNDNTLCLKRFIKTSSHEISHMFSMFHCINAVCAMNGTNNLPETDSKPNRLCTVCLSKLYWNLEFSNKERLEKLQAFFLKHGLKSDYELVTQDLSVLNN